MDWRYNTIWWDQIDPSKVSDHQQDAAVPPTLEGKEYVTLLKYKQINGALDLLPSSSSVLYFELIQGGTTSLEGIDRFPSLKRLEVHYCTKLLSDVGLSKVSGTLRHLHIGTCKKFTIKGDLLALANLEVLCLNECGELPDLDFLDYFPRLQDFRFVDTNVKSGDLSPLLRHKNLKNVGFLNKRHYSHKSEEIQAALEERNTVPFKEFVHKGPWMTFRYLESS